MKIKRKIEMVVATKQEFVIRKSPTRKPIACAECGSPELSIAQTARMFGITQRRIFRIIEAAAAHFTETEAGALMICLTSLANSLEADE